MKGKFFEENGQKLKGYIGDIHSCRHANKRKQKKKRTADERVKTSFDVMNAKKRHNSRI